MDWVRFPRKIKIESEIMQILDYYGGKVRVDSIIKMIRTDRDGVGAWDIAPILHSMKGKGVDFDDHRIEGATWVRKLGE